MPSEPDGEAARPDDSRSSAAEGSAAAQPLPPNQAPAAVPASSAAGSPDVPSPPFGRRPFFAHPSEAEFARILDFYAVRWEYEPQVFPILWDLDGNVLESFAPDFYLPDMDLFVEMTTLRQSLVRKKNRKVRRLRELYPSINIKLLYARDFHALLFKYGRTALADELSGTIEGLISAQAAPDALLAGSPAARMTDELAAAGSSQHRPHADGPDPVTIGRSRAARRRAARRAAAASSIPVT